MQKGKAIRVLDKKNCRCQDKVNSDVKINVTVAPSLPSLTCNILLSFVPWDNYILYDLNVRCVTEILKQKSIKTLP